MKRFFTSSPRSIESARNFCSMLLNAQVPGVPLRLWPVIIEAETEGYHVVECGFARNNNFKIID